MRAPRAAADVVTTSNRWFDGGNASLWRADLIAVNGFDCALGYGWEDRSLGVRLRNRGLRARQVRNRAVVLHLEHDRPYRTEESLALGLSKLRDVRRAGTVRVEAGIDELDADGWVRRYPEPATND